MSTPSRPLTRRSVLAAGAGVSAAVGLDTMLPATALATTRHAAAQGPREAIRLSDLGQCSRAVLVARRLTYGATPALVGTISRHGAGAFVDAQLQPASIDDSVCDGYLRAFPLIGLEPEALRAAVAEGSFEQMSEMQTAALVRAAFSERQLFEMLVELWWNHFNVGLPSADVWDLAGRHDNLIRRHALGRFSDLLRAMAQSPALLHSLNQDQSVGQNPNENYGRELLELHTVGVGAGYSEHDVHQSSLLLTGLSIGPDGFSVVYRPGDHYIGAVRVMSFSDPNTNRLQGGRLIARYLGYLAHHPATAAHLATKLARRFVCDEPPPRLISALARTYLEGGTAIVPVLRCLFSSPEFLSSAGQKLRRPLEAIAAALRVLDYRLKASGTSDIADLGFMLEIMGQAPMGWMQPNGYPDTAAEWMSASATQSAWAAHLRLAGGWWTKQLAFPGLAHLIGNPSSETPAGHVLDRLVSRLLFAPVKTAHRAALLKFMDRRPADPIGAGGLVGLPMVAKVILDSPYFALR
ncbi:MAG: DUF1800 domain-containing protein [Acidimicrobiales bacterium]